MLLFIDKIPSQYRQSFSDKVVEISDKLDIDPNWLMVVFKVETGNFDWKIENSIGCVGLIQFCPDVSRGAIKTIGGKTLVLQDLKKMSPIKQLDWVYEYFKPYKDKINSFYDLYLFNFYPYAVGKPDSYVIGSERSMSYANTVAKQNKILDINGDGYISISDYKKFIDKKVLETGIDPKGGFYRDLKKRTKRNWIPITILSTMLIGLIYIRYAKPKN